MNIIIATTVLADSGYEERLITEQLLDELKKTKHKVDYCFLPYHRDMIVLPEQVVAYQMMKGLNCDLLITIGYPAIYLNHHNKVSFLFQLEPMLYEYYNTEFGVLSNKQYENIRGLILNADKIVLNEANMIFVNSKALQSQILEFHNIKSELFYLPNLLEDCNDDVTTSKNDYIVTETDLFPESRYEIILETISKRDDYRLLLSVPRTSSFYREVLEKRIIQYKLDGKVEVINKPLSRKNLLNARCFLSASFRKSKISNSLIRASGMNLPIIVTNDSGAECEVATSYCLNANFESSINSVNSINSAVKNSFVCKSINELVKKMVM